MQTIIPTARLRITLRLTTSYYVQATFKMSILIYLIQIDQVCYSNCKSILPYEIDIIVSISTRKTELIKRYLN